VAQIDRDAFIALRLTGEGLPIFARAFQSFVVKWP